MADRISTLHDSILCHILSFLPTKHAAATSILSKRWNSLWLLVLTLLADRISTLPNSVLCNILSFLPTKHAAATSILSKRWKSLWLLVPSLDFDIQTFRGRVSFRESVKTAMISRNITLPILSFRFKCHSSACNQYDVNRFVNFAMQRGIENLSISIDTNLPHCILRCMTLKVLKLKKITVKDLSHQVDFPNLKILHLETVFFQRHEYLVNFLSGCPKLEELQTKDLRVVPPDPLVPKKKFTTLANLIKARVFEDRIIPITLVCNVQSLRVDLMTWVRCTNIPAFHNLTYMELTFSSICFPNMWDWLLIMLDRCRKLQNFIIQDCIYREELYDRSWKDPPIVPKCLSSQLRTCSLMGYKGKELELQFAKYILQHSKVLQTMTVKCSRLIDVNEKQKMLMYLSSLPRGSSTCELLSD